MISSANLVKYKIFGLFKKMKMTFNKLSEYFGPQPTSFEMYDVSKHAYGVSSRFCRSYMYAAKDYLTSILFMSTFTIVILTSNKTSMSLVSHDVNQFLDKLQPTYTS